MGKSSFKRAKFEDLEKTLKSFTNRSRYGVKDHHRQRPKYHLYARVIFNYGIGELFRLREAGKLFGLRRMTRDGNSSESSVGTDDYWIPRKGCLGTKAS